MSLEMFLKLTGIGGELTDAKHHGEIAVVGWNWGLADPTASPNPGSGSGAGRGKVKFDAISIQKSVDVASPLLQAACAEGRVVSQGVLSTRRGGGDDFLIITLTDVVVASVGEAAAQQFSTPTETIGLLFARVEFDYRPTLPNGGLGPVTSFRWDVLTNSQF